VERSVEDFVRDKDRALFNRKEITRLMDEKWEFYKDRRHQWRWRRKTASGRIIGESNQGYEHRSDCEANAERIRLLTKFEQRQYANLVAALTDFEATITRLRKLKNRRG